MISTVIATINLKGLLIRNGL